MYYIEECPSFGYASESVVTHDILTTGATISTTIPETFLEKSVSMGGSKGGRGTQVTQVTAAAHANRNMNISRG